GCRRDSTRRSTSCRRYAWTARAPSLRRRRPAEADASADRKGLHPPADRRDMSFSNSPHIRIIVLVGVATLLGLMILVVGLSRHSSQTSAPAPVPVHRVHPKAKASPPARRTPVRPAPRPAVAPKHRPNPFVRAALAEGWPRPVARLLGSNKVVVL